MLHQAMNKLPPGSRWWKFDFHTHTPASSDYGRGEESAKQVSAEEWLREAMTSGLDCVVITDHNTGGWIDVLKAKYNELQKIEPKPDWYKDLIIFPGVEISVANCSSRVHLLAVFGTHCDSQKITSVLGACGITSGFGDDQHTSTNKSFVDTVDVVRQAGGIPVPAHIDQPKGLLYGITGMNDELKKSLKNIRAAEFCDHKKYDTAEPGIKKHIDQIAKVAGSDAHNPAEIGRHYCWLKMSSPSIEGLSLALSDHEYCVKNQVDDPNCQPDLFLSKLSIRFMRHCGRDGSKPFSVKFNPHFNTIIGGRGTGKSTIIESIRIAMRRDQSLKTEAKHVYEELSRFMSTDSGVMLQETKKNTEICLEINRREMEYQLRWRVDGQGIVLSEKTACGWVETEAGNLLDRFPISIFSQKHINALASNPRGLLEIIDRSPEVNLQEWKSRWENVKSQFLQLKERKRDLLRQLADEKQLRVKLDDVLKDLKLYEEKGHGEILKLYQKHSHQMNSLPDTAVFDGLSVAIRNVALETQLSDFPAHIFDEKDESTNEIREIHKQATQALQKISEALGKLADDVDKIKSDWAHAIQSSEWYKDVKSSVAAYEQLVKEYSDKQSSLSISLYGEWVSQRNLLNQQLQRLESVKKEYQATEKEIAETTAKLVDLRCELFERRKEFIVNTIGVNAYVRMELVPYGDTSAIESEYRNLLNLEEGKFTDAVYNQDFEQSLLWSLVHWEEKGTAESKLPKLIENIKSQSLKIAQGQEIGYHGAFLNRMRKLLETQPAVFDQLEIWYPQDLLRVKYSKDPGSASFTDLKKGSSAGQKAAAILAFLLSYGHEPLVIDQPEDDLDNALIYDLIVRQIHENKNRRQLIIATHNPNIVVNGDSELVNVLKFSSGQMEVDTWGSLEEKKIRDAICTIMEGGREAFDKRYRRMSLEG